MDILCNLVLQFAEPHRTANFSTTIGEAMHEHYQLSVIGNPRYYT